MLYAWFGRYCAWFFRWILRNVYLGFRIVGLADRLANLTLHWGQQTVGPALCALSHTCISYSEIAVVQSVVAVLAAAGVVVVEVVVLNLCTFTVWTKSDMQRFLRWQNVIVSSGEAFGCQSARTVATATAWLAFSAGSAAMFAQKSRGVVACETIIPSPSSLPSILFPLIVKSSLSDGTWLDLNGLWIKESLANSYYRSTEHSDTRIISMFPCFSFDPYSLVFVWGLLETVSWRPLFVDSIDCWL